VIREYSEVVGHGGDRSLLGETPWLGCKKRIPLEKTDPAPAVLEMGDRGMGNINKGLKRNRAGFILPPRLRPGDRVAVVAPAGPLRQREQELAQRSMETLRAWGLEPCGHELSASRIPYLAAPDEARAEQLRWALTSAEIRGIFCLRGGYGSMRLLPLLEEDLLKENPKVLVGFSDVTALLLGLGTRAGVVTFHGPTLASSSLASGPDSPTAQALRRAVMESHPQEPITGEIWQEGEAEGPLLGGCLSLISALMGTDFFPELEGCILFLEDVGEPLYRLDRMLYQLKLGGVLGRIAGLALGNLGGGPRGKRILKELVLEAVGRRIPVLAGLPCGHGARNLTLTLGAWVRLDKKGLLIFMEAGVSG